MQYGVPFHRVVQVLDNLPDEIIMVMDHRASAHQMKNWKEKRLLRSVVMDSVSYKPSSSLGSGFELVDRVYRLNSTHESGTRESNSAWLTSPASGLKLNP